MSTQMNSTARRGEHPLSMRPPDTDIAMIDHAASLRGRTRADFMREATVYVLIENTLVRMSEDSFEIFMAAVAAPALPVVEMFSRKASWARRSGADRQTVVLSQQEALTAGQDVATFSCENQGLDDWLKTWALSNQQKDFPQSSSSMKRAGWSAVMTPRQPRRWRRLTRT